VGGVDGWGGYIQSAERWRPQDVQFICRPKSFNMYGKNGRDLLVTVTVRLFVKRSGIFARSGLPSFANTELSPVSDNS